MENNQELTIHTVTKILEVYANSLENLEAYCKMPEAKAKLRQWKEDLCKIVIDMRFYSDLNPSCERISPDDL